MGQYLGLLWTSKFYVSVGRQRPAITVALITHAIILEDKDVLKKGVL